MTEHKITQAVPWPPYPEARYMLSRWQCSCGWRGEPFKDSRYHRDECSRLQAVADDHAREAEYHD